MANRRQTRKEPAGPSEAGRNARKRLRPESTSPVSTAQPLHEMAGGGQGAHIEHARATKGVLFRTYAALMVLLVLTVLASFVNLHALNAVVAIGIAAIKAILVILYFMQVRYTSTRLTPVFVAAGFFWLAIMAVGIVDDLLTRGWLPVPGK